MKYEEMKPLLKWRSGNLDFMLSDLTSESLSGLLSVEGLRYDSIPVDQYDQVVAFRKRGRLPREALCRRFLAEVRQA